MKQLLITTIAAMLLVGCGKPQPNLYGNWFVKSIYTEAYGNNEKEIVDIMTELNITNFKFSFSKSGMLISDKGFGYHGCDITMTLGEIGLALWKMKDGYVELPSGLGKYEITFSNNKNALLKYTEEGYAAPGSFFQYIQNYYDVDNEDETRTLFLELERE